MVNVTSCSQCKAIPSGVLFSKKPDYIDRFGCPVQTGWERVGQCVTNI